MPVVVTSIAWKRLRSSIVPSGPCPGMILAPAGIFSIIAATFLTYPSTLPPESTSMYGNVPLKNWSPMWTTFEPLKKMIESPSV